MTKRHDCIVIGAGFAGLTAAKNLSDKGLDVLCLEARNRVGGRTEPGRLAGLTIDLGGMWLGPTQARLAELAEAYQVRTYPTFLNGEGCVGLNGRLKRVEDESFHLALPEEAVADFERVLGDIAALSTGLDLNAPWDLPTANELDGVSVAGWLAQGAYHADVIALIDVVCQSVLCAEPNELSLLFFLFYCASGGGIEILIAASDGGAQNFLFDGGVHQIAQRIADGLADRIKLGQIVRSIRQEEDQVCVETEDATYRARRVICATPPAPMQAIQFDPPLPYKKAALIKRQPMGSCIKCWIAYDRPFWRDRGLNGLVLNDAAPFTPMFDVTPPDSDLGILSGFFDADAAIGWTQKSPEMRKTEVLREIIKQLGPLGGTPIDYIERDWTAEPYSQGCYGAYMTPGTLTKFGDALRAPVGSIHWAGTETSAIWSGYIEGAIRSGERAADEVASRLVPATTVFS